MVNIMVNVKLDKTFKFTIDDNNYDINIEYLLSPNDYIDYYDIFVKKIFGDKSMFSYLIHTDKYIYNVNFTLLFHNNYDLTILKSQYKYIC